MSKLIEIEEKELERLRKRDEKLAALEAGGVDDWCWYGDSLCKWVEDYHLDDDYFSGV